MCGTGVVIYIYEARPLSILFAKSGTAASSFVTINIIIVCRGNHHPSSRHYYQRLHLHTHAVLNHYQDLVVEIANFRFAIALNNFRKRILLI